MCQDGRGIQDSKTKRGDGMDKGSIGMMMEIYTLGDGRMTSELKEGCTSCKMITLTHSSMSSMMKTVVR
jgi:hypothetical protein